MKSTRNHDNKENLLPDDDKHQDQAWISSDRVGMSTTNKNGDDMMNEALLEKLKSSASKIQENAETIRSSLAKLHLRVTSSDRRVRERTIEVILSKEFNAIEIFLILLETCKDNSMSCSITGILHECISPRASKVKIKGNKGKHTSKNSTKPIIIQLIQHGGTQVFLKLVIASQRADSPMTQVLVQELLWILGQISQKDPKFPIKVRLLNTTKVFHTLLKQYYNDSRMVLPLLLILKSLAKNTFAVQILVKDGISAVFEKLFVCLGYSPHLKLKILLECFKYFTTNRLCCAKFVKAGIVHLLMRLFERWDRWDGPIRQKIVNYALCTLHHLCSLKCGRRAIKANNGLQLLYRFCTNCPEAKAYDYILSRVCGIINQCLEKKELPVPEMSPARFYLPNGSGKRANSVDSCSDVESPANSVSSMGRDGSDDSADEQDEETPASTKLEHLLGADTNVDEGHFFASVITSQRSLEDLLGYTGLFSEINSSELLCEAASSSSEVNIGNAAFKGTKGSRLLKPVGLWSETSNWTSWPEGTAHNDSRRLCVIEKIPSANDDDRSVYCHYASRVRSIIPFVKVAYPDLIGGYCHGKPEPLNDKDRKVCRAKLLSSLDRGLAVNPQNHEVVYDLDALTAESMQRLPLLTNVDETHTGCRDAAKTNLQFESRFESGNLRKAIQIGPREYDLILTPDVNSGSRHQWFYFEVSNMEANIPYTFNIINCEKANSQFNFGMKPILFSVKEAQSGRHGWTRTGSDICYYRNCYRRPCKGKNYLTTSFTVDFPHSYDICYLAYHFPYTYSLLLTHIFKWTSLQSPSIDLKVHTLCDTLNNNECPLLSITSVDSEINPIYKRKIIFLTSRVHPGESNSSWVMHGTLEALLADSTYSRSLRDDYIFKIVPMLNIEGVINGCNRYGLTNEDLNRRWSNPNRVLHPVIYHTKGIMEYCSRILQRAPHVFVDYHGHSRRKNVFLFGCSRSGSWSAADREKPDQPVQYLMLPRLMEKTSPAFALPLCSFKVERNKESTARVAIWRQLGVARSYTMESSFCGCDQGPLAGLHLDTVHLRNVGRDFCQALAFLKDSPDNCTFEKFPDDAIAVSEEKYTSDTDLTSSCDSDDSNCTGD